MSSRSSFAVLTPPGIGAIAVTRLMGPLSKAAVLRHFCPVGKSSPAGLPCGESRYGMWRAGHGNLLAGAQEIQPRAAEQGSDAHEDLIVIRVAEEVFEIQSHGGVASTARIAADLSACGLEPASWQDQLRMESPWFVVEPELAFLAAPTERVAGLLWLQRASWREFALQVREFCLTCSADSGVNGERLAALLAQVQRIREESRAGDRLLRPARMVLFGPPNAGKSRLLNCLAGFDRSIVHEQAGTTRDVVGVQAALAGWPVEILDTAGLHTSEDPVEQSGMERSRQAWEQAELRILVLDAADSNTPQSHQRLAGWDRDLVVWNKSDLHRREQLGPEEMALSALTGEGLPELVQSLGTLLERGLPPAGQPVLLGPVMQTVFEGFENRLRELPIRFSALTDLLRMFPALEGGAADQPGI